MEKPDASLLSKEIAAEWVTLRELKPWARNPRKNAPALAAVVASIERFGFGAPIVARKANGEIIAGHTRYEAAKQLGLPRVPVRYLDLDESSAHALALADNRLGEMSEWDQAALSNVLAGMSEEDRLVAGFGDLEEPDPASPAGGLHQVDVTSAPEARFWLVVEGPLPLQPDVLDHLRAALAALPSVTVNHGTHE